MHEKVIGASLPAVMALAYLGDARHSLYVRYKLVERGLVKSGELNEESLRYVTCERQAEMFKAVEHLLLEDELETYKRAANSSHLNRPKRSCAADYRIATGFEAIIGMLEWIGDEERLALILDTAHKFIDEKYGNGENTK